MTASNDAWLAGVFEGEGYIGLINNSLRIVVQMVDEDVVRRFHDIAGCGHVNGPYGPYGGDQTRQPSWMFKASGIESVSDLVQRMGPWLGVRRTAQCATALSQWRPPPALPTHCKHGHEYTPENTYLRPKTKRQRAARVCKTCFNKQVRKYKARKRKGLVPARHIEPERF